MSDGCITEYNQKLIPISTLARIADPRLARVQRGLEPPEPFRRQRRQQSAHVTKVMRRGGMADARALGHAAQGEGFDASFRQLVLGSVQQGRGEVTVVIRAFACSHTPILTQSRYAVMI